MAAHVPEITSSRRFTVSAGAPSFAGRSARKVQRFRHRSAPPPPSSRDGRRSSLWCQHVLSRPVWLHPALPPTCRYTPHAIPRCSPLVVRCSRCSGPSAIHRREHGTWPQSRSLSRQGFIAGCYTFLCAMWHFVSSNTNQVQSRHKNSERVLTRSIFVSVTDKIYVDVITPTYILNTSDSRTTKPFEYVVRFCQSKRVNVSDCEWSVTRTTAPTPTWEKFTPRPPHRSD